MPQNQKAAQVSLRGLEACGGNLKIIGAKSACHLSSQTFIYLILILFYFIMAKMSLEWLLLAK